MDDIFKNQPPWPECPGIVHDQQGCSTACFVAWRGTLCTGVIRTFRGSQKYVNFADSSAKSAKIYILKPVCYDTRTRKIRAICLGRDRAQVDATGNLYACRLSARAAAARAAKNI